MTEEEISASKVKDIIFIMEIDKISDVSSSSQRDDVDVIMKICTAKLMKLYQNKYVLADNQKMKLQQVERVEVPLITSLLSNVERLLFDESNSSIAQKESTMSTAIKELRKAHDNNAGKLSSSIALFLMQ